MLGGQEIETVLRAVEIAFAEEPAGADRDLRLNHVVAGAQRITIRIEKGQNTCTLVGLQKMPTNREKSQSSAHQVEKRTQPEPANQYHAEKDNAKNNSGA